ncbi:MAG: hypothetical protein JKY34_08765 [Kordiimonadaceae bacterium]|nr:hypothetical protein [Kordiimonadaceae bacterium]
MTEETGEQTTDETGGTGGTGGEGGDGATVGAPTWLPEADASYFNADTGGFENQKLFNDYSDLRKSSTARTEDIKKTLLEEVQAQHTATLEEGRVENASDYTIKLPDNFLPDGMEFDPNEPDAMLDFFKEFAHGEGLNQEQFNKAALGYMDMVVKGLPDPEAEYGKLENGVERAAAADMWLKRQMSEDGYSAIGRLVEDANGIKAVEEIMNLKSDPKFGAEMRAMVSLPARSEEELQGIMRTDAYQDPTHKDYAKTQQEVSLGFQKIYGSKGVSVQSNGAVVTTI